MEITSKPIELFKTWFDQAHEVCKNNPNAISLATVNEKHQPDVRYVLLKNVTANGFEFFTNRKSTKAQHIVNNQQLAFSIYWRELGKQIRVKGIASELTNEEVFAYFKTRSRNSQIGAWASNQSHQLTSLEELRKSFANYEEKFKDEVEIPLPDYWTGFLIEPLAIEFWQEGADRLHERVRYFRESINNEWQHERLYP